MIKVIKTVNEKEYTYTIEITVFNILVYKKIEKSVF